jgi:hypothetical protein
MKRRIRMKLLSDCRNKLQVVKLIKDCTGLGLRESKDIADEMFNYIGLVKEIELREPYIKDGKDFNPYDEFTKKIHEFGHFQITGGLSWERDAKMLGLGIGDIEDYANFVSDYMSYNNNDENKMILEVLFSKLKREDLVELVNKINNYGKRMDTL